MDAVVVQQLVFVLFSSVRGGATSAMRVTARDTLFRMSDARGYRTWPLIWLFVSVVPLVSCKSSGENHQSAGLDAATMPQPAPDGGFEGTRLSDVGNAPMVDVSAAALSTDTAYDGEDGASAAFTTAACQADTCRAEATKCGWGSSDAKYLGCLSDCSLLGVANALCPKKVASLYACASLGEKVDCSTGKGTGCDSEEQQVAVCLQSGDGGSKEPGSP
jgi:hypothetical protein